MNSYLRQERKITKEESFKFEESFNQNNNLIRLQGVKYPCYFIKGSSDSVILAENYLSIRCTKDSENKELLGGLLN